MWLIVRKLATRLDLVVGEEVNDDDSEERCPESEKSKSHEIEDIGLAKDPKKTKKKQNKAAV